MFCLGMGSAGNWRGRIPTENSGPFENTEQLMLHCFKRLIWIVVLVTVSGCVSSTLDSSQFRPVGSTSSNKLTPESLAAQGETSSEEQAESTNQVEQSGGFNANPDDPRATTAEGRQQGIAEIRSKAEAQAGEKIQIGPLPESATEQLTPEQQRAKAAALAAQASAANGEVGDAEVVSKHESIRRLRARSQSHYNEALKKIEN